MQSNYNDCNQLAIGKDHLIQDILLREIVDAKNAYRSGVDSQDDIDGIDWFIETNAKTIACDVKYRKKDYCNNDIVLEIWSNFEKQRVGWSLDSTKKSDIILWYFCDTKRYEIFPFPILSRVFQRHLELWKRRYKIINQKTIDHRRNDQSHYHSQAIIVPIHAIVGGIHDMMS